MLLTKWRLPVHALAFVLVWLVLSRFNMAVDPLMSYYLALAAMYATAMFGMVILVGLSGQVSLGNGALMAVGGYAFAVTTLNWQTVPLLGLPWNAVWSVVFAGLIGVLVGVLVGVIGARLRGPYLAGLTLGLAVGLPAIANRFEFLGGPQGLILPVPYPEADAAAGALATETADAVSDEAADEDALAAFLDGGASAEPSVMPSPSAAPMEPTDVVPVESLFVVEQWQASIAIAVACIVGFIALNLVRGRQGKSWRAVRDDPIAAAVVGISPAQSKVTAFVVSSLFAALAGAVFAQILTYVGPGAYGVGLSLSLLVGIVLGGRGSLVGAVIGAVLLVGLPNVVNSLAQGRGWDTQVTANMPNLLYGLLLVAVVLVAPGGLVGVLTGGWRRARRSMTD